MHGSVSQACDYVGFATIGVGNLTVSRGELVLSVERYAVVGRGLRFWGGYVTSSMLVAMKSLWERDWC
jgi:hypothetical protein